MTALVGCCRPTCAADLPWTMLVPANDTRAKDMVAWDEADSRNFVKVVDAAEEYRRAQFRWGRCAVARVLEAGTPFAELRIDPVRPMALTGEEKAALKEWLLRGGFLLVFEDCYPYEQEAFRKEKSLPVFDFITRELPAEDKDFTVERATDSHPIFTMRYATQTVEAVRREMRENANYRGRTMLLYRGRVAVFFMGRYSVEEAGRWVPMRRPFVNEFGYDIRSYYLILNIYLFATMR